MDPFYPEPNGLRDLVFVCCVAGPFVSVLLSRLENMLENSPHVNLLLTGIIAQLAAYPQLLLRSFLLNTNMVFQPSVRSLYQVQHQNTNTPYPDPDNQLFFLFFSFFHVDIE